MLLGEVIADRKQVADYECYSCLHVVLPDRDTCSYCGEVHELIKCVL